MTTRPLPWLPPIRRHRSGALWCETHDAPLVLCGSQAHNPNHQADIDRNHR